MNKNNPLISIITPVYNRERLIVDCIRNVQNQTYINYEHIIIDDGSTDATIKNIETTVSEDKRIRLITSSESSGGKPGKVRNIGLRQARGEYVAFLDSDDLWEKDKLSLQLDFMLREKLDVTYHPLGRFTTELKNQTSFWGRDCSYRDFFRGLFLSNFIPTCSVMVKRGALEKVGFFDESLQYSEDYFLWLMLSLKGYSFGFMNPVLGGFRRNNHGNINSVLEKEGKSRNDIALKERILFEHWSESIPRLMKSDLFYGYVYHYFELIKNESTLEKKKFLFAEAMDRIFKLNLSTFFSKELELLIDLRKKSI